MKFDYPNTNECSIAYSISVVTLSKLETNYRHMKSNFVKIFFVINFLIVFGNASGSSLIDSLKNVVATLETGTQHVDATILLSREYISRDILSAKLYALDAAKESNYINYKKGIGEASLQLGDIYFIQLNSDSALFYYNQAFNVLKEVNDSKNTLFGYIYAGLANIDSKKGMFESAYANLDKALKVAKSNKDEKLMAVINLNRAYSFNSENKKTEAKDALNESLKFSRNEYADLQVMSCVKLAELFVEENTLDSALFYIFNAIRISKNYDFKTYLDISHKLLGDFSTKSVFFDRTIKEIICPYDSTLFLAQQDSIHHLHAEIKEYSTVALELENRVGNYKISVTILVFVLLFILVKNRL